MTLFTSYVLLRPFCVPGTHYVPTSLRLYIDRRKGTLKKDATFAVQKGDVRFPCREFLNTPP